MTRFHCMFKQCKCTKFHNNNVLCNDCNHHKIWHSRKNKCIDTPPSDGKLQFMSSRKNAHKPSYAFDVIFAQVFIPEPLPLAPAIEIANPCFCPGVPDLPV